MPLTPDEEALEILRGGSAVSTADAEAAAILRESAATQENAGREGVSGWHSFAIGAGSGAVKTLAETGRGLYEAANRRQYRVPDQAQAVGLPFGGAIMRDATPEERAEIDAHNTRVAEIARGFYDPTIESMRHRIDTMAEYNPASTKAGNTIGTVAPSVAAAATGVAAPIFLGAQIGGMTLGEARARGEEWDPASGQAVLMGGLGVATGRLAGPAFQAAKVAAPFASPWLNLGARAASTYAVGQGIGAGFSAAGELGPLGGGDPWGAMVETVNEPAVIGMAGLPTFGSRRFVTPAEIRARALAGDPAAYPTPVGPEGMPVPVVGPLAPLPLETGLALPQPRRLVEPLPVRDPVPDPGLPPIEVPGSVEDFARRPVERPSRFPAFPPIEPLPAFDPAPTPRLPEAPIRTFGPEVPLGAAPLPPVVAALPEAPALRQIPEVAAPKLPEPPARSFPKATAPELPPVITPEPGPGMPVVGPYKPAPVAAKPKATNELPMVEPRLPEVPNVEANRAPAVEVRPAVDTPAAPVAPKAPAEVQAPQVKPGQRVDVLDPTGKVAVKDVPVLSVDAEAGTVTIQNRSTGKTSTLALDRVATREKAPGELPPTTFQEKPTSFGPRRNMSRRGSLGVDPLDALAKLVEPAMVRAGRLAVKGGKLAAKAALAPVDLALWGGRTVTQDLYQKMERNPKLSATADRFKEMQADAGEMLAHPDARAAIREVEYSPLERSALNKASAAPEMPKEGIHVADSLLHQWITGVKDLASAPDAVQRIVRAIWKGNKVSLGFGKGVEGVNQSGFPEGKGIVHFFADPFIREIRNLPKAEGDAIIKKALADPNGMTVDQARTALGEMGLLEAPDVAVVRRNPIEMKRVFKNVPSHLSINGRVIEILDLNPRRAVQRTVQGAASRVAFIKRMGSKLDPSMGDAQLKELLPALDAGEIGLLRKAIQEWHGIETGIDAGLRAGTKKGMEFAKTGETSAAYATRVVSDALSEIAGGAGDVFASLALTASQPGNIASVVPGAASVVGPVNTARGLAMYAKARKGNKSALVENGMVPEIVDRMGRADVIEQGTKIVESVISKISRPIDRQTAMVAGWSGMAFVDSLRSPAGYLAKATAWLKKGADLAILKNLNYSDEMAQRLVSGKGSEAEYHQVVRDVIEAVTGQGGDMLSKSPDQRIRTIPKLFYFMKYPAAQLRGMVRIMDNSMQAARKGDMEGAAHGIAQAATKAIGLTASGAATALALAAISGSAGQLLEKPMALLWEGLWRGWWGGSMQSASTILGLTGDGKTRGPVETIAQASFPVGLAYSGAKALSDSRKSRVGDEMLNMAPLIDFAYSRVPGARRARDFIGLRSAIDTGAKLDPERRATTAFYEFAKKNPEYMSQEIDPDFTPEVTPLYDAVRRVASMKGIDPEKLRRALIAAGLEGKTQKDIADKLRNKRMTHRFKGGADARGAFVGAFAEEHGISAAREILLHDMRMDALADMLDPPSN